MAIPDEERLRKLREVLDWLKDNDYLYKLNGKFFISNQVYRELELVPTEIGLASPMRMSAIDEDAYKKFISDAGVPSRIQRSDGGAYYANRYSIDGAKEFTRIIRSGYILDILLESTRRYYKNGGGKTITNYMTEGIWQTGYEELIKGAQRGPKVPGADDHRKLL